MFSPVFCAYIIAFRRKSLGKDKGKWNSRKKTSGPATVRSGGAVSARLNSIVDLCVLLLLKTKSHRSIHQGTEGKSSNPADWEMETTKRGGGESALLGKTLNVMRSKSELF